MTVVKFRSIADHLAGTRYTDALTTLEDHPLVTAKGDAINPTLKVRGAVDFEIRIATASAGDSYSPIAIVFVEKVAAGKSAIDRDGKLSFGPARVSATSLFFRNHCERRASYEFLVVVRRTSDGALGVIDPGIENEVEST